MIVRQDAGGLRLGATPIERRPDGYRVYRGRIPADVVMDYPDLSPPRSEFVPASEALSDEALATMRGAPFTITHPDDLLDATTARQHMVGTVLAAEADWSSDPPAMVVEVIVHDAEAQDAIESGRMVEISPGYRSEEDWTAGEHRGRRYQVVQRRRRNNHLSGVPKARTVAPDGRPARLDEMPGTAEPAPYPDATAAETNMDETETSTGTENETTHPSGRERTAAETRSDAVSLSPEDIEVLKKMSPEGFMAVSTALGLTAAAMPVGGGEEEVEVVADAPGGGPPGEAPAAGADAGAGGGGGSADPAFADALARIAKLEAALSGGGTDNAAPMDKAPPFGKKDAGAAGAAPAVRVSVDASAALASAATQRADVERVARATFDASAKFVDVVRRDGHDAVTPTDAAAVMVRVVAEHLPALADEARADVRAGGARLDALANKYRAAEKVRRDGLIARAEDGVAACLRADDDATVVAFRAPRPRGA